MDDDLLIYVKDNLHKARLIRKYPQIKAEYVNMQGADDELKEMLPMVCAKIDGVDTCEIGEEYILEFSKKGVK